MINPEIAKDKTGELVVNDVEGGRLSLLINIEIKCLTSAKDDQTDVVTLTVSINDKLDKIMQSMITYNLDG